MNQYPSFAMVQQIEDHARIARAHYLHAFFGKLLRGRTIKKFPG